MKIIRSIASVRIPCVYFQFSKSIIKKKLRSVLNYLLYVPSSSKVKLVELFKIVLFSDTKFRVVLDFISPVPVKR